jgi:hypothetical protein
MTPVEAMDDGALPSHLPPALHPFTPAAFSSAPTPVVMLYADRIALPEDLRVIPLEHVLPPEEVARYVPASSASSLLRPAADLQHLNDTSPVPRPRIAGSRVQYVRLIGRLHQRGMIAFTAHPRAINGVFAVAKDADADRLIIDAQPANRLFVDSPHIDLPNPSHLVQLQVPHGAHMMSGKSDLSNFYHHMGLPVWMQPYFALLPLTAAELASLGLPSDLPYPMCITLPMGFSHAVRIAQLVHLHMLYPSGILSPSDNLLSLSSPVVSHDRVLHGVIIDDFFLFSLNRALAQRQFDAVISAYRRAGFVVKQSKVVNPTSAIIKVIGFDIDGVRATIRLNIDAQLSLMRHTLAVLQRGEVTGATLSHIIGRWTWVILLRRPALAVLQHAYRFIAVAGTRRFTLWPSVRRELQMLLYLLPLLDATFDAPHFTRVVATDASELAAGVVTSPLTPALEQLLWPVCSNRRIALLQTQLNTDTAREGLHTDVSLADPQLDEYRHAMLSFDSFYTSVMDAPWRTIVSSAWRVPEHINALELRAALLAVHWVLSFPTSLGRRVFLLVDSTAAFFTLWKGRSSSPTLLLVLRKVSALLLAGGLSLLPGWIPSAVNPADAPSRSLTATL